MSRAPAIAQPSTDARQEERGERCVEAGGLDGERRQGRGVQGDQVIAFASSFDGYQL